MKITNETEERIKRAVRDIIAIDPLVSVSRLQRSLAERNFVGPKGNPLDWHYVAKVVRKVTREGAMQVDTQKLSERILPIKERYRLIAEEYIRIGFWRPPALGQPDHGIPQPSNRDKMKALELLLKLDLAILRAEIEVGLFERSMTPEEEERLRAKPLSKDTLDRIANTFARFGIVAPQELTDGKPNTDSPAPLGGATREAPAAGEQSAVSQANA